MSVTTTCCSASEISKRESLVYSLSPQADDLLSVSPDDRDRLFAVTAAILKLSESRWVKYRWDCEESSHCQFVPLQQGGT